MGTACGGDASKSPETIVTLMGRLEPALGERQGGRRKGRRALCSRQCQRENPRGEKGREGVRREGGKVRTAVTIVPAFWGERAGQK